MIVFLVVFLALLIFISGYFSAAETALFSLSPLTVKAYRISANPRLNLIAHLMEHPRQVLVTLMIVHILANILVQNVISSIFESFPNWTLKVGVPLLLTLLFGDILPKSVAMPYNTSISYYVAPSVARASRWIGLFRDWITSVTSALTRYIFFFLHEEKEISIDELRHVLKTSEQTGVLIHEEADLIDGMLKLQQALVKERMRPREEMLFYDIQEPLSRLSRLLIDLEITRVPVCDGSVENMLGILSTRSYFLQESQLQAPSDLLPILKKPYYVPETTKCWTLLQNLRERDESLALVVDEYGSISGLITQEDLIEAVVGEISDKRDEKSLYTRSGPDVIIASGKLELEEFREIFGIALKSQENAVTLGGWLIEQLGDIPSAGTKYANDQFLFYVLAADPNRIRRIYVRKLQSRPGKS
ncbi:MAG: HlyC/CorC family transporter [Chlamydiae bacterium]|nr:HlyC/CorC family transporter [Chlamydiota bacterium]